MRSAAAGAAASASDLVLLTALVQLVGISPRSANVPALLTGAVVMYFGQKYLAFRAHGKASPREIVAFAVVQIGGLALTGLLFDLALRFLPEAAAHYVILRLATTNFIWLFYSFPLWHWVFRSRSAAPRTGNSRHD